jgi:DNA-binding LacI/PurR family transcriptional regulator
MKRLLEKAPEITALFAQNDRMAIGAMRVLREAGRRIPEDVAVVGYDDIPVAAYCEPPLSTIRQPMREVGRVAVDLLLEAIENPQAEKREVLLKTELIVRESCGGGG